MGLRDNKLLRSKQHVQAKNKFGAGENQPTPDQQLTRLEDDIRRLRVEFDIFFNGGCKAATLRYQRTRRDLTKTTRRRSHAELRTTISLQLARRTLQRVSRSLAPHDAGT